MDTAAKAGVEVLLTAYPTSSKAAAATRTVSIADCVSCHALQNGTSYRITAQLCDASGGKSRTSDRSRAVTPLAGRVLLIGQSEGLDHVTDDYSELRKRFREMGYDIADTSAVAASLDQRLTTESIRQFFEAAATAEPRTTFVVAYLGHGHGRSGNWVMKGCRSFRDQTGKWQSGQEDRGAVISLYDVLDEWQRETKPQPPAPKPIGLEALDPEHRLVLYLDSCYSGAWVEQAHALHKENKMPPRVHIQAACDAKAAAVDGSFTRQYVRCMDNPSASTRESALHELRDLA